MKVCNQCGVDKPETEYYSRVYPSGKHYIYIKCKKCCKAANNTDAVRKRSRERKRKILADPKLKAAYNKTRHDTKVKQGRAKPMNEIIEARKRATVASMRRLARTNAGQAWRYWLKVKAPDRWLDEYYSATGKPWNDHRLSRAEQVKTRYAEDAAYNLSERLRRQSNKARKKDGIGDLIRSSINRGAESSTVTNMIGCKIAELMDHFEKQFTKGMNWDVFKRGDIHIDHIVPQSNFDLSNANEWRKCWALSNLRPLWADENRSKSNKQEYLL